MVGASSASSANVPTSFPGSGAANTKESPSRSTQLGSATDSAQTYFQSVARIGMHVAEALACAHAHGVLHRDIKPSNLLLDTEGAVWVTDFGLAKAEGMDELTHTGDIVGTLRYMAPERFSGKSDPRSDVYSLGLTLYELLTLRAAFEETDRHRLIQQITQTEPPRPRKLERFVPADLETIVLKASDREPERRYQSATEMAEDLSCFLADRPIQARRASNFERIWRWCRRNPGIAASSAAAMAALLIGLGVALWQWHRADENAQQAEANALQAKKDFELALQAIEHMLERVGGDRLAAVPHMDRTRRALLEDAARLYQQLLQGSNSAHPEVRLAMARVHCRLGQVHGFLNDPHEAVRQQDLALVLLRDLLTGGSPDVEHRHLLAKIHLFRGLAKDALQQIKDAEADFRQALPTWENLTTQAPDRPEFAGGRAYTLMALGNLLRATSRAEEAEPLLRQTIAIAEELPASYAERARLLAFGFNGLGVLLEGNGRPAQAEAPCRRALEIRERTARERPEPHNRHELAVNLFHLARLRARDPKGLAEAEKFYTRSVEIAERLVADSPVDALYHDVLADGTNGLGLLLSRRGRLKEAEAMLERSASVCKERVATFPRMARYRVALGGALNNLAQERRALGDLESARTLLDEAIAHQETVLKTNPSDAGALEFLTNHHGELADLLLKSGKPEDAEKTVARQRALAQELMEREPQSPSVRVFGASAAENLARFHSGAKRLDEAAAAYGEAAKAWRALHVDFPEDAAYASQLGAVLNNWAIVCRRERRWVDMARLLDEAIQFQEKAARSRPEEGRYRQYLYNHYTLRAEAGMNLGDHAHVVAAAAALRARLPERFDDYFWAVRIARCIPLAKKDADLSAEKRDGLARQYAEETMALLQSAQRKSTKDLPQIHTNPAFQPLRNRADFQELLAKVAKPAKSGK